MRLSTTPLTGWNDLDALETSDITRLQEDQEAILTQLRTSTRELSDKIGLQGSLGQVSVGGVTISAGLGVTAFADGLKKSTIEPDGDAFFGSNISLPTNMSLGIFANGQAYNAEMMEEGDILIGDNSDDSSNVKWDASEGQLQFRLGTTVNVYMDTDGTLRAGAGVVVLDANGISIIAPDAAVDNLRSYKFIDEATGLFLAGMSAYINVSEMVLAIGTVMNAGIMSGKIMIQTPYAGIFLDDLRITLNALSQNVDVRILAQDGSELIHADAASKKVGIKKAIPGYDLDVAGPVNIDAGNAYKIDGIDVVSAALKGVTNGDSHDHHGGDGNQISYGFLANDGWTEDETNAWSYSSADSPTFVISINADMTPYLQPGMKIKLTQTTAKYFIVTAVGSYSGGATLVTVYGGTDYTLANAAITSPKYSHQKTPLGFPMDPLKWTVETTNSSNNAQATPVAGTIYNVGGISINIPIGAWDVSFGSVTWVDIPGAAQYSVQGGLGTATNTLDAELKYYFVASGSSVVAHGSGGSKKNLLLATKTTYYLNAVTGTGGATNLRIRGDILTSFIRARCAYL